MNKVARLATFAVVVLIVIWVEAVIVRLLSPWVDFDQVVEIIPWFVFGIMLFVFVIGFTGGKNSSGS